MIKVEFSGETSADVHAQIKAFAAAPNEVTTAPAKKTKTEEPDEEEPSPKKKAPAKKAEVEELDDATLRAKIKANDWPVEQAKAFIGKFGFKSIPVIPAKRREEFVELLTEAGSWSAKKLSAYLEDEDADL